MPDVTITIGGRNFDVACQEGEEHFLQSAAQLLDNEASVLTEQIGRLPESRMLFNNSCRDILGVAEQMMLGEMEYHQGNHDVAFDHLRKSFML